MKTELKELLNKRFYLNQLLNVTYCKRPDETYEMHRKRMKKQEDEINKISKKIEKLEKKTEK